MVDVWCRRRRYSFLQCSRLHVVHFSACRCFATFVESGATVPHTPSQKVRTDLGENAADKSITSYDEFVCCDWFYWWFTLCKQHHVTFVWTVRCCRGHSLTPRQVGLTTAHASSLSYSARITGGGGPLKEMVAPLIARFWRVQGTRGITTLTRKSCTGQVLPSAKYRPTRLVVDATLRRIVKSRHGEHKIANISVNCQRIWKRISPMDLALFFWS